MMIAYIHSFGRSDAPDLDLKQIVPDALMRRRMSRIVRDGVKAAWMAQGEQRVDAILTATAMGCLTDSEKFLRNFITTDEQLLSPTSFIQSTFNTIGATIALLQGNHCYNMTYTHGADSLASALLDAVMILGEQPDQRILVGAVEEFTPTLRTLLGRMGVNVLPERDGACFFTLSSSAEGALARLEIRTDASTIHADHRHYADPLAAAWTLCEALAEHRDWVQTINTLNIRVKCL